MSPMVAFIACCVSFWVGVTHAQWGFRKRERNPTHGELGTNLVVAARKIRETERFTGAGVEIRDRREVSISGLGHFEIVMTPLPFTHEEIVA